jgi:lipopolysaccharide/colanic/teichoic acid biosynthesis glycosyltransferase
VAEHRGMGRVRTFPAPARPGFRAPARPAPLLRGIDVVAAVLAIVVAAPLLALLALLVRTSSHGPVLSRELAVTRDGRRVELLSFRTVLDGAGTEAAERIRAVIGAAPEVPFTRSGRAMRALGLDRLPRLVNIVAGQSSFFS